MTVIAIEPERILLAGTWITVMLIYLLGDIIRIFAGHIEPGTIDGEQASGWIWTVATVIMLVPIAMILGSLLIPAIPLKWITIVVAAGLLIFNLVGMPYKGFFDNMLLVISFGVNAFSAWIAWTWHPAAIQG